MSNSTTVSVSNFKAHCLEYVEHANQDRAEYIVTKRNKPVARLIPIKENTFRYGKMKGTGAIIGDIMSPIDAEWDALQ